MYQILLDNRYVLYDSRTDYFTLINPKVSLEVNKVGTLSFKIYDNHPHYEKIKKLKSIIKVYQNGKLIFRGRVLEDTQDFYNGKQVQCESELAFLLDSIYRPFNLINQTVSIKEWFTELINNHNSQVADFQRFKIGNITVEDKNEKINFSSESALKTSEVINTRLIETYGGYLYITYDEKEMPVLNYVKDFDDTSTQSIEFGKNLLDISNLVSGSSIATAMIPYGAKKKITDENGNETESTERIDITSVNNGLDYIYDREMANEYGFIYADPTLSIWEDVTEPSNLLTKAKEKLAELVKLSGTIELTAIDLANVHDIESFYFCDYIQVLSLPHGIDKTYLLQKIEIDIVNPANTKITLGETYKTLTEKQSGSTSIVPIVEKIFKDYVTNENIGTVVNEQIQSSTVIEQTAQDVVLAAMGEYVEKTNFDEYKETNASELQVLAEGIIANFNTTISSIENVDGDLQQKYEELKSYIRGYQNDVGEPVVELGNSQSTIKLKLENDEIWFDVNGVKRFYLTAEGKIVFKNAVFEETTEINGFAFVPRSNGNLSFVKVKEG